MSRLRWCAPLLLLAGLWLSPGVRAQDCPPEPQALAPAQLQQQARDRGLLWRISRAGHQSYLYASLHLGRPAWAAPGPQLRQVLDQVDALALEIDPLDSASMALPELPAMVLTPAQRQRLEAQVRLACLPPQALASLPPLLQLSTLMLLQGRHLGLDVRWGQEMLLSRWARDRGLPVLALESVAEQLQVLLPEDPAQQAHELETGLRQLQAPHRLRRSLNRLVTAWEAGDLRTLARYEDWCDCIRSEADRAALRRLNDGRNPALAQRISSLHGAGQSLLVAVGALHMTGPQALPTLLRQAGFTLELVHPR
jgi:uncharacterized protein YbaP (TraB family)